MNLSTWTTEQLLSLASDQAMVNAGQSAADPGKWARCGRSSQGIWGEFSNRGKPPQQTFISLPNIAPSCNCHSRKFPCRHVLGLTLLYKESPQAFNSTVQPAWLPLPGDQKKENNGLLTRHRLYEDQLNKAQTILEAYARWLHDLIHSGLATLPKQPPSYWSSMAQRLQENGLYTLGQELRQLPAITKMPRARTPSLLKKTSQANRPRIKKKKSEGPSDWPLAALQQLGRHYLITQGFANYQQLPPAAQADLRYAAGWFVNPDDPPAKVLRDRWLVIGTRFQGWDKETIQHSWLWGVRSRRFILLSRPFPRQDPAFQPFIIGGTADATLHLLPGAWPFRAQLARLYAFEKQEFMIPVFTSLKEAQSAFGRALSANPWLNLFPLVLGQMEVQRLHKRWYLRDRQGFGWPLPIDFTYGWHLAAMQKNEKTALFGEWNGQFFNPLSFIEGSAPLPMHIINGVK